MQSCRPIPDPAATTADIHLCRADAKDAALLHRMKHEAFWPLYEKYHDDATSPALELLSKVKHQIASEDTDWYIIHRGGEPVGGLRIVRERSEDGKSVCRISPLFVLPAHQGQGIATAALLEAFALYPEAVQWRLSTILQEHGLCRMYERLCFRRVEVVPTACPGMDIVHFLRLREDIPMRRIARLTDQEVLGVTPAFISRTAPRFTARAILQGPDGRFAVTHTEGFGIHMLPGGGIEMGESIRTALHREMLEETGCRIATAVPLGYVEENRGHADYAQLSFYFLCTTADAELRPQLTEAEISHGATVRWMTREEMNDAIRAPRFERYQGRFLQARDVAALDAFQQMEVLQ